MNKWNPSKSTLIEIKNDARKIISENIKTSEKLVITLTITRTFDWLEEVDWIESELYGYDDNDSVPSYRMVPYTKDSGFRREMSGRIPFIVGTTQIENWIKDIQYRKNVSSNRLVIDQWLSIGPTQKTIKLESEEHGTVIILLFHLESILSRIQTRLSDIASRTLIECNTRIDQSSLSLRKEIDTDKKNQIAFKNLKIIFTHFHEVVVQLRKRHDNKETLDVKNEYDVQDLLHSLLRLYFNDIRKEEPVPSSIGSSARMDFLLKEEEIGIEVKKTSKTSNEKKIGSELAEDLIKYQKHPDCKTLFCFIYDPENRISNPYGFRKDLEKIQENYFTIMVYINPETR